MVHIFQHSHEQVTCWMQVKGVSATAQEFYNIYCHEDLFSRLPNYGYYRANLYVESKGRQKLQ